MLKPVLHLVLLSTEETTIDILYVLWTAYANNQKIKAMYRTILIDALPRASANFMKVKDAMVEAQKLATTDELKRLLDPETVEERFIDF